MIVVRAVFVLLFSLPLSIAVAVGIRTPDAGTGTRPDSVRAVGIPDAGAGKQPPGIKHPAGIRQPPGIRAVRPVGSSTRAKKVKVPRNPPIELFQINSKETFPLRFADERGRPIMGWQKRFQRFMRCHHTNTQHRIDPRLPRLLYQTGRHFAGHRLEVVSGYRNPKVAHNPKSPHKKGLACDFHVAGVSNATLRDYLRQTFTKVGVGYYPNSLFVHLDVRRGPSAFWIDYSGPGEGAVYSGNSRDDLRTGRADWYAPPNGGRRQSATEHAESVDDLMETTIRGGATSAAPKGDAAKTTTAAAVQHPGQTPSGATN